MLNIKKHHYVYANNYFPINFITFFIPFAVKVWCSLDSSMLIVFFVYQIYFFNAIAVYSEKKSYLTGYGTTGVEYQLT